MRVEGDLGAAEAASAGGEDAHRLGPLEPYPGFPQANSLGSKISFVADNNNKKAKRAVKRSRKDSDARVGRIRYMGTPFPPELDTDFTIMSTGSQITTSGIQQTDTYRLNSLYDPEYALGGLQPGFFAALCNANVYRYYMVYAAAWEVRVAVSTNAPCNSVVFYSKDASPPSSMDLIGQVQGSSDKTLSLPQPVTHRGQSSIGPILGHSQSELFDSDFETLYNADPSEVAYLHVSTRPMDLSTAVTVYYRVKIKFKARLSGLHQLVQ